MTQEGLRRHVLRVLRMWRSWSIFSDDFLNGLQVGLVTCRPAFDDPAAPALGPSQSCFDDPAVSVLWLTFLGPSSQHALICLCMDGGMSHSLAGSQLLSQDSTICFELCLKQACD